MPDRLSRSDLLVVQKLWGQERIIVNNGVYCGKILTVNPGYQCSMHYHKNKTETFFITEGRLLLEIWAKIDTAGPSNDVRCRKLILNQGDSITLEPYTPHRFSSLDTYSCTFFEFSSPDSPEDSYRLIPSGPKV